MNRELTGDLAQILAAVRLMVSGESLPSFRSDDFAKLLAACTVVTTDGSPAACEAIGRVALLALLDGLSASMQSERALAMMRDSKESL